MKLPAIFFRRFEVPFLEKFGRWLFSWRSVRTAVFGTLVVLTLIAMFYVVENWRGRYAWKKYRAAAATRGVQFDFRACIMHAGLKMDEARRRAIRRQQPDRGQR